MGDWIKSIFASWLGVPAEGRWSLQFQPPTSGWMILAVVGTVALFGYVWFVYRMEGKAGRGKKVFCAVLRCLSLLLLLWWVLPRPVLKVEPPPGRKDAYILVLLDSSQSQTVADHYEKIRVTDADGEPVIGPDGRPVIRDIPAELAVLADLRGPQGKALTDDAARRAVADCKRVDLVNKILGNRKLKILDEMDRKYRVIWTTFDESLNDEPISAALKAGSGGETAPEAGEAEASPQADHSPPQGLRPYRAIQALGRETDISRAIRQAIKLFRGRTLAAIVVLTDGRSTSGEDVATAAQYARNQPEPVPIFTVAVGDPNPPKNIRVATPQANEFALRGDQVRVQYEVDAKGFAGRQLEVKLEVARGEESPTVADVQDRTVEGDPAKLTGAFQFQPPDQGEYTLTVRCEPLAEEINSRDNAKSTTVKVRDEKIKVLLVAGGPNWEYRNLKNLFVREKSVLISCWLQSASREFNQEGTEGWRLTHLPRTEAELFNYDVIMLVDPSLTSAVGSEGSLELNDEWFALLKKFVQEHGGGLVLSAGRTYTGKTLTGVTNFPHLVDDLLDLLPIIPDANAVARDMKWPDPRPDSWPMKLTEEGKQSAILRMSQEDQTNETIWEQVLPGPFWCFPAAQEKPAAQVLMRHTDKVPGADGKPRILMAAQFAGAGRVFYSGTDSTWLWNRVGTQYYGQFWGQALRFVVRGRLLGGRKYAVAQTDKDAYNLGDTVKVWTPLRLPDGRRPTESVLSMTVKQSGEGRHQRTEQIKLKAEKQVGESTEPVRYAGEFYPSAEGTYEFTFVDSADLKPEQGVGKKVEVKLPEVEFLVPQTDEPLLRRVAATSGGPAGLEKFLLLADITQLPGRIPTVELAEPKEPILETLWDRWQLSFLPFMLLLVTEWVLRKLWRML